MTQMEQQVDVAVVGAGPIGIELGIALQRAGLKFVILEARQIGHTLSWWPRDTYFFSTTERIELAGVPIMKTNQERTTGEEYLAYLRALVEQFDLPVRAYEPVTAIRSEKEGFTLTTSPLSGERTVRCRYLVLANGDMDEPNRLGIPGEDLPHVSHYFSGPYPYFRQRLLVVGGRNTAVEAALRCWRAGAQVTLSYRRATFDEKAVKHFLLPDLLTQIELGTIGFLPETTPLEIRPGWVKLKRLPTGEVFDYEADFVLLATGFIANPRLFELAGVNLVGAQRAPEINPDTMETNVPGVFVAGTAAAGTQTKYRLFIENCHTHVGRILRAITGHWPEKLGTIPQRQYEPPFEDIQTN